MQTGWIRLLSQHPYPASIRLYFLPEKGLAQIFHQYLGIAAFTQFGYALFPDLTYTFARKSKLVAYLFQPFSWHPMPKHSRMMVISRSFNTLLRTVLSSSAMDSWSTTRSVRLSSPLGITSSIQLSSPSWNGASMLT